MSSQSEVVAAHQVINNALCQLNLHSNQIQLGGESSESTCWFAWFFNDFFISLFCTEYLAKARHIPECKLLTHTFPMTQGLKQNLPNEEKKEVETYYFPYPRKTKTCCVSPVLCFGCQSCYMFCCVRKLMKGYLFSEITPDLNDHKQLVQFCQAQCGSTGRGLMLLHFMEHHKEDALPHCGSSRHVCFLTPPSFLFPGA